MPKIFTNQIRHTNVAIVRLKKGGKRFEIACYKNKVLLWRQNNKTDIDEVLQTHTIFTNVSKGQMAKKQQLTEIFGKSDETEICKKILKKGKLQGFLKERQTFEQSQLAIIASRLAKECVIVGTRDPLPTSTIKKSLEAVHFHVKLNKSLRQQTLEAIKVLERLMPIARARMMILVSYSEKRWGKKLTESILKLAKQVEIEEWEGSILYLTLFVDPGNFRTIFELVRIKAKGKGSVQFIDIFPIN